MKKLPFIIAFSILLTPVAAWSFAPSAKQSVVYHAYCSGEVTNRRGASEYLTTLYLTQLETISLPAGAENGGSPALRTYSNAAYQKWKTWREARTNNDSTIGDCHFDQPGIATYEGHKAKLQEALSEGAGRVMEEVHFDFPAVDD